MRVNPCAQIAAHGVNANDNGENSDDDIDMNELLLKHEGPSLRYASNAGTASHTQATAGRADAAGGVSGPMSANNRRNRNLNDDKKEEEEDDDDDDDEYVVAALVNEVRERYDSR